MAEPVAFVTAAGRGEATTMQVSDEVRAGIEAVVAGEVAAWNRGDSAAFAAATTDDVAFTNIVGMFTVGRAAFEAQHARIFATVYRGSTMTQQVAHVALLRPDVALVDSVAGLSGFAGLPPGVEATDGVLQTRLAQVMVDDGGTWRVASFHNVAVNARAVAAAGPR